MLTVLIIQDTMLEKHSGEVSEWPKEHDWKSCVLLKAVPRVQIPPSPLIEYRLWIN